MTKTKWKIIGKGMVGWHANSDGVSSSSYDSRNTQLKEYLDNAEDDVLIYDGSLCDPDEYTKFVINGPMCKLSLQPDEVQKFGTKTNLETSKYMIPMLGGSFRRLAILGQNKNFSGLDFVGIAVYESLLRKLNNMRIGHIKDKILIESENNKSKYKYNLVWETIAVLQGDLFKNVNTNSVSTEIII